MQVTEELAYRFAPHKICQVLDVFLDQATSGANFSYIDLGLEDVRTTFLLLFTIPLALYVHTMLTDRSSTSQEVPSSYLRLDTSWENLV
jgi:hypothetical protein